MRRFTPRWRNRAGLFDNLWRGWWLVAGAVLLPAGFSSVPALAGDATDPNPHAQILIDIETATSVGNSARVDELTARIAELQAQLVQALDADADSEMNYVKFADEDGDDDGDEDDAEERKSKESRKEAKAPPPRDKEPDRRGDEANPRERGPRGPGPRAGESRDNDDSAVASAFGAAIRALRARDPRYIDDHARGPREGAPPPGGPRRGPPPGAMGGFGGGPDGGSPGRGFSGRSMPGGGGRGFGGPPVEGWENQPPPRDPPGDSGEFARRERRLEGENAAPRPLGPGGAPTPGDMAVLRMLRKIQADVDELQAEVAALRAELRRARGPGFAPRGFPGGGPGPARMGPTFGPAGRSGRGMGPGMERGFGPPQGHREGPPRGKLERGAKERKDDQHARGGGKKGARKGDDDSDEDADDDDNDNDADDDDEKDRHKKSSHRERQSDHKRPHHDSEEHDHRGHERE